MQASFEKKVVRVHGYFIVIVSSPKAGFNS